MAGITQAPAPLNLTGVAGSPFALTLNISATDSDNNPIPWSDFTNWAVTLTSVPGASSSGIVPTITNPSDGVLVLSWTIAQTTAILERSVNYVWQWALVLKIEGDGPYSLVAGNLVMRPDTYSGSETASANLSIAVGTATASVAVTLAGGGGGGSGTVTEITSDDDTVTISNPDGPVVDLSVTAGTGTVDSVVGSADIHVDATDPANPVVSVPANTFDAYGAAATAQAAAEAASDPAGSAATAQSAAEAASVPIGDLPLSLANGGTGGTSQQTALDTIAGATTVHYFLKGNGTHVSMAAIVSGDVPTLNQNTTGTAANLSGTPALPNGTTATTQSPLDNSTKLGTTAYVDLAVGVETTRAEAAEALLAPLTNATLVTPKLGTPQSGNLVNCTFPTLNQNTTGTAANLSGMPALPNGTTATTQSAGDNSTKLATTVYTDGAVATGVSTAESFATSAVGTETSRAEAAEALLAPLASPALTGTPTAPTKTALTNNTDIATTAYADSAVGVETARAEAAEALLIPLTDAGAGADVQPASGLLTLQDTENVEQVTRAGAVQPSRRRGSSAWDSFPYGLQQAAAVGSSVGTNINTYAGAGTLTLANPTNPYSFPSPTGPWYQPSPCIMRIAYPTSDGLTLGYISYTGTTLDGNGNITAFTGCTTLNGAAGVIPAGASVYSQPFAIIDVVSCADSILQGVGSNTAISASFNWQIPTDWFSQLLAKENRQAGLPDPGRGWRPCDYPFVTNWTGLQQPAADNITAVSGSGTTVTFTCANAFVAGQIVTLASLAGGFGGMNGRVTIATASSTQFTVTNATTGATTTGTAQAGGVIASTSLGPSAVADGISSVCYNPGANNATISDTVPFRRSIVFIQKQTNGATVQVSFNGGSNYTSSIATAGTGLIMVDSGDLGSCVQRVLTIKQTSTGAAGVAVAGHLPIFTDGTAGVVGFNFAASATTASQWANTYTGWDSIWLRALQPRRVYTACGVNDLATGRTLTQLQTDTLTNVGKIQAACPNAEVALAPEWHVGANQIGSTNSYLTGYTNAQWFSTYVAMVAGVSVTKNASFTDLSSLMGDAAIWNVPAVTTTSAGTSATNEVDVANCTLTTSSAAVTTSNNFLTAPICAGMAVVIKSGTGTLPANSTVLSVTDATHFTLSTGVGVVGGTATLAFSGYPNVEVGMTVEGPTMPPYTNPVTVASISGSTVNFAGNTAAITAGTAILTFTNDILGISAQDGVHFGDQWKTTSGRGAQLAIADMWWNNLSYYRALPIIPPGLGWSYDVGPWVRVSNTQFTITDFRNLTSIYAKGVKVTWTESGTQKYGVVGSSSYTNCVTTVNLIPTTDYVMAATPDPTSSWYSTGSPPGFPTNFSYTPTFTGFSSAPSNSLCWWSLNNGVMTLNVEMLSAGTSNATGFTVSLPVTSTSVAGPVSNTSVAPISSAVNNSTTITTLIATIAIAPSATTAVLSLNGSSTGWTASGNKNCSFQVAYPI